MVGGGERRGAAGRLGRSTASTPTAGPRRCSAVTASTRSRASSGYAAVAYGVSAIAGLWPMVPRAFASLRFGRLDMHVLVCLSAIGAAAIGQWAEAAAVAFLFAIAHLMEAWSIERARHAVARLVGHEPGWGDDGGHEAAPVERWIERFAAIYTPVVTFARDRRGAGPADRRRPVGGVVLSRPDLPGAGVSVRAGDLDAGDGGRGADVGGPARRAVQGRRAARARGHREDADAAGALSEAGVNVQCRTSRRGIADSNRVDVVLTCDHDEDIAFLVSHAKRALRVIRQNVALALATKLAFLVSAVFGAAPLWLAVVADTGATVAVTLNGLRLLRAQTPE